MVRSPEPTDIYWENLNVSKKTRKHRKLISALATAVVILISAGIIVLINLEQVLS